MTFRSWWLSWLRQVTGTRRADSQRRRCRRGNRPGLERLEDRLTPATFTDGASSGNDNFGVFVDGSSLVQSSGEVDVFGKGGTGAGSGNLDVDFQGSTLNGDSGTVYLVGSGGDSAFDASSSISAISGGSVTFTSPAVNIDLTSPTISGAVTRAPNNYGWYNGDVAVHWTTNDALSGIDPGTVPADSTITGVASVQFQYSTLEPVHDRLHGLRDGRTL